MLGGEDPLQGIDVHVCIIHSYMQRFVLTCGCVQLLAAIVVMLAI